MPAFTTHYIFARELMPVLRKSVDFNLNDDAVLLGAQGPDIFFFHRVFPWMNGKALRHIGSELHRAKPGELFEHMRDYLAISSDKNIAKSYVYGFILHYALDRNCHPFVYYLQNKITEKQPKTNPNTAHNTVEFAMDSYMISRRLNINEPEKFDTASTVNTDPELLNEAGLLLHYVIEKTIHKNISADEIKTAFTDLKYIQQISCDPTQIKRNILSPIENFLSPITKNFKITAMMRPRDLENAKKYGNINRNKWKSPFDGTVHNESFEDLFELAKADALSIIKAFANNCRMAEITDNISFLTGVEVK